MATAIFEPARSLNSMPSQEDLAESGTDHARRQSESGTELGSGVDSEGSPDGKSQGSGGVSAKRSYHAMLGSGSAASPPEKKPQAEKPLEDLTGEEIQQLTREECRRYLKEKGMRRPSWNKAQATQQLLCLKNLIPLNTSMRDEPLLETDPTLKGDMVVDSRRSNGEAPPSSVPAFLFGQSLRNVERESKLHDSPAVMAADSTFTAEEAKDHPWNSTNLQQRPFLPNNFHLQQQMLQDQNKQGAVGDPEESTPGRAPTGTERGKDSRASSGGEEETRTPLKTNSRSRGSKREKKAKEHTPRVRTSSAKSRPRAKRQQGNKRRNSKAEQDSTTPNGSTEAALKENQVMEESAEDLNAKEKSFPNCQGDGSMDPPIPTLKRLTSLHPMFSFPNLSSLASINGLQGLSSFSSSLSTLLNGLPQASSAPLSPALNQSSPVHSVSQLQGLAPSFSPYQSQTSLNPSSTPSSVPSPVPPSPPPTLNLPSSPSIPSISSSSPIFSLVRKNNPSMYNNSSPSGDSPLSQCAMHTHPALKPLAEADAPSLIPTQSPQRLDAFMSLTNPSLVPADKEVPHSKEASESSFSPSLLSLRLSSGDSSRQDAGEAKGINRIHRPSPTRPTLQNPQGLLPKLPIKASNGDREKLADPLNLTISLGSTLNLGAKEFPSISSHADEVRRQMPLASTNPNVGPVLRSIPKAEGEKHEGMGFYQFRDHPLRDHFDPEVHSMKREMFQETLLPGIRHTFDSLFPVPNERSSPELQNQVSNWSAVIENLSKIRSYLPPEAFHSLNPAITNFPSLPNAASSSLKAPESLAQNVVPSLHSDTLAMNTSGFSNPSRPFVSSSSFQDTSLHMFNSDARRTAESIVTDMDKVGKMTIIYNGVMKTFESIPYDKANAIMLLAGNSCASSLPSQHSPENSQLKSSLAQTRLHFRSHPPSPSPPFSPPHPPRSADDAHHSSPPSPAQNSLSPMRSTSSATSILPSSPQVSPLNSLASQTPSMLNSHGSGFSDPAHPVPNDHMSSEVSARESTSKKAQGRRGSGPSTSKKPSNSGSLPPVSGLDPPEARKASLARFLEKRKGRKQKLKNPRN